MPSSVIFTIIAAAFAIAMLGGVLWPLWRGSRAVTTVAVIVLALSALALYWLVGTPAALSPRAAARTPLTMQEAVFQLEAELARDPDQPEGWQLLARSYGMLGRDVDAREAYARALKRAPDDPDLLVEAAQTQLMSDPKRRFDADSVAMLQRALRLQPAHQRARWLLGVWQRQNGRAAEAARTWQPLLSQVDAKTAATLRAQIDVARKQAGLAPLTPTAAMPETTAGAHAITVYVALAPTLAGRVPPDASVFIIARVPHGPPMPVAVEKHAVRELPLAVTLDDGDSPMPTRTLSALDEVEVFARLSASGNAIRQAGDIETAPVRVTLPAKQPVELLLGGASP